MGSPGGETVATVEGTDRAGGPSDDRASRSERVDLRLALLAGATRWRDPDVELDPVERIVVGVLLTGSAATLSVAIVAVLSLDVSGGRVGIRGALAAVLGVVLIAMAAPSVAWALGRRPRRRTPVWLAAAARVVAAAGALGCFTAALGRAAPLAAWIPGIAVGSEAALTVGALGPEVAPYAGWRRFELSSMHLGMLAAVAAMAVVTPRRAAAGAVVYVSMQVLVLTATAVMSSFKRLHHDAVGAQESLTREAVEREHRRVAHWIHDDVSSALRLARMRIEAHELDHEAVGRELEELDHRIRLRQLDEVLASGSAQVAEVLQPYVRVVQENGIEVTEVPRFDRTSAIVDESTGRRLQRALAVLVPNAIQAGATAMAFRISDDTARFLLEIEDDAGGFDAEAVPAGRGLDALRRELGEGAIEVTRTASGSRVRARVRKEGVRA